MTVISGVNQNNQNILFKSRHINIHHPENFPKKLINSIKNNKALDEFVKAEEPKTLLEKIKNIFKKDEYIDFYYDKCRNLQNKPAEELLIDMGKITKKRCCCSERGLIIVAEEKNNKKNPELLGERVLKEFEKITDFNKKLTPNFDIIKA